MTKTEAVNYYGSKIALARALKVAPSQVTQWKEDAIPMAHAYRLEKLTFGKLRAKDPFFDESKG